VSPTILIVDDDERFLAAARRLLEAEGFDVVGEARTGSEACTAVPALRPDLVLLDVNLPDSDGFEIAERLAAGDSPPPVVLTSSWDGTDYGSLVEQSSACAFIPKADISGPALAAYCG
jgi:DNA-binding NarL/FixJ family response regulator